MLKNVTKLFTGAIFVATLAAPAFAIPVTWTFNNAVFDDGSSVTGSFTYDADAKTYDLSNTTLICLSACGGETVTNWDYVGGTPASYLFMGKDIDPIDDWPYVSIHLNWANLVTTPSADISIHDGELYYDDGEHYTYAYLMSGATISSSVVPIPAAVWLFGSGLGVLGWLRRSQTA